MQELPAHSLAAEPPISLWVWSPECSLLQCDTSKEQLAKQSITLHRSKQFRRLYRRWRIFWVVPSSHGEDSAKARYFHIKISLDSELTSISQHRSRTVVFTLKTPAHFFPNSWWTRMFICRFLLIYAVWIMRISSAKQNQIRPVYGLCPWLRNTVIPSS